MQAVDVPDEAHQVAGVGRALHDGETVDWPVHGLRYLPENETSGWYLWTGDLLQDEDLLPLHPAHLAGKVPRLLDELAAPPGSRFLLAPGHRDAWFDPSLLEP